jgi:hypothetical protein
MLRLFFAVLVMSGIGNPLLAQSKKDLADRYKPVSAYEIRPGILMLAEFDAEGEVCEVTLATNFDASGGRNAATDLTNELADELVDELSPASVRGPAHEWLNPDSTVAGGSYFDKKDYENVSVERYGTVGEGLRVLKIIWMKRRCATASRSPSSQHPR